MQENGLGLVSYLLGFEAVFAWQSLCENQHFYKKKPHFSWFPANLGAEGLRIRNKTSPTNQSGKVGRWLLMFQSVDLFILFICWCWSLPNLVLGMLNSNQLRGHEFSSTIPPYPRSCAPEGYVQTRMPFILRLCNFDLTWNFGESELSTAPTAASPASRYKIPDIFGYVTEIYSFRLGLLRKRGLWWLMHTFIFGLGMIRESHFLQMHWCLVLDAQGSIKELVTRMSNPLYSDPPKSNAVQWLCSRDSTPVANLYISRLHLEVLHGALPQQGTRVSAIWVTRGVTEARAYRACQLGKGLICAGGLWCSTGVLVCCL